MSGLSGASLALLLLRTHLQFKVVSNQLVLLSRQVFEFSLIVGDLLPHHTGRVPTKSLPLSRQLPTFLSVIVKEAAEVPQLLVVLRQSGVEILEAPDLCLKISNLLIEVRDSRSVSPGLILGVSLLLPGCPRVVTLVVPGGVRWLGRLMVWRWCGVGRGKGCRGLGSL